MAQRIEKIALTTSFPIGPVNVFLIFGEKLTLTDAGVKTKQAWQEFQEGLDQLGLTIADIEQIILTHHHNDHTGLLEWILEKKEIPVYAHIHTKTYLLDQEYLNWSGEFFEKLFLEFGLPSEDAKKWAYRKHDRRTIKGLKIAKGLTDGDEIPGLSGWIVIETKGHSQDHISLYSPKNRIFICGDFLIDGIHPGIFLDAPFRGEERAQPLLQYISNLEKCLRLPIDVTYSGHGPEIDNLPKVIQAQFERTENRVQRLKQTLTLSSGTGLDIVKQMYAGRYKQGIITFLFEVISVLDLLLERNEIKREKKQGVYIYHLQE